MHQLPSDFWNDPTNRRMWYRSNLPLKERLAMIAIAREFVQEHWLNAHCVFKITNKRTGDKVMAIGVGEVILDDCGYAAKQPLVAIISDWYAWPPSKGDFQLRLDSLWEAWQDAYGQCKYEQNRKGYTPEYDWGTQYQLELEPSTVKQ